MTTPIRHRPWCAGPHHGQRCATDSREILDGPTSVTVRLEQAPDAPAPVVVLDAVFAAGAVLASVEFNLDDAAGLRDAVDSLLTLARPR